MFNKKFGIITLILCIVLTLGYFAINTGAVSTVLLAIQGAITDGNLVKFSGTNGIGVDAGVSATNVVKCKFDATSAPTVNNDVDEGYTVGSRWLDITNDKEYVCLDNADGVAIWTETTAEGGGATTFTGLTDTPANYTGQAGKYTKVNAEENALEFDIPAGAGDMTKAVYDIDTDNIADKAETVDDGVGNSSTASDVKDAVTKKHTQNTDTALGTLTADVNMGTHKLTNLSAPVAGGDSIRATTKITEANLESAVDHKDLTNNPHTVTKSQVGLGNVENLKVKLDATSAPGVSNDNTEGYAVGSRWVDINNDKEYVALDVSTGAAIWTETTATGDGALTYLELTDTPATYDNGKYARSTADGVIWDTPSGAGDMLKATYDTDADGDVDVAAGGTEKSVWTQYAIPYLSGTTAFGEISIGTAEYALTVNAGETGYDWTLFDLSLYYLKTEIDSQGEVEIIWGVTLATDTELAALTYSDVGAEQADAGLTSLAGLTYVSDSFIKVIATDTYAIRTYAEVKDDLDLVIGTDVLAQQTIGIANDSLVEMDDIDAAVDDYCKLTANGVVGRSYSEVKTDLGIDLTLYYLKTEIDTQGKVEDIWGVTLATDSELAAYTPKSLFNAYTILYADTDDTPAALYIAASRIVGRAASGGIAALDKAAILGIINVEDGADVTDVTNVTTALGSINASALADITSTGANIEDAVTKKHTQNTDTALGTQTEDLNMGTHKIIGVVDPVNPQEAATKAYADTKVATEVDPTVDSDAEIKAILVDEVTKTGSFTAGRIAKINNATGIIEQGTNTDTDVADAVTKKHTAGADTTLGTLTADVNMGTHKLTGLSVPSATGQSVRTTATITEANLEDAVTKKHSQNTDTQFDFYNALADDHDWSGDKDTQPVGESVVFGDLLYFNWTDKEWKKSDADAAATVPGERIALESKTDGQTCLMLVKGYIRDDSAFEFTASMVYTSITPGAMSSTAPTETGDQVQRVGVAKSADILFFCPSIDVGEI